MSVLQWGNDRFTLSFATAQDAPVRIVAISANGREDPEPLPTGAPLVEIATVAEGRKRSSQRYSQTAVGSRLRYSNHQTYTQGHWDILDITQHDPVTGLTTVNRLRSTAGSRAVQSTVTVTNRGGSPIQLQAVTSLTLSVLREGQYARPEPLQLVSGSSQWLGENQWSSEALRQHLPDLNLPFHGQDQRGHLLRSSASTWSTGGDLPTAALLEDDGWCWMWQVEHNGGWAWELGEDRDTLVLSLLGPTDEQHQWLHDLAPGESFTTVPATVAFSQDGLTGALQELSTHRRALRGGLRTPGNMPVVYNDFMNTLMGDPSTDRLLPLVSSAAEAGADVFCIDAGWYDEENDWWDGVGEWLPAAGKRFPHGLGEVTDAIRARGMTVGLWLEPEVVGRRSPAARLLPASAFLSRRGHRVMEHGRYHLDLRDPEARAHLDTAVDRLVQDFSVGYFKFDYNITPGAGTDFLASSPGDGLLGHSRAYLEWIDGVRHRHQHLLLENCASGAMRQDYALLSRFDVQSTSDQQEALRYPPIAANSFFSVLPEQAAHWSCPQPSMDDEQLHFTLATGMLGRMCLSGFLDRMTEEQLNLVAVAVAAHKELLPEIGHAFPFWPSGIPEWTSPWVSAGLHAPERDLVTVWNRGPDAEALTLDLPRWKNLPLRVETIGTASLPSGGRLQWDPDEAKLTITFSPGTTPAARTLSIRECSPTAPRSTVEGQP